MDPKIKRLLTEWTLTAGPPTFKVYIQLETDDGVLQRYLVKSTASGSLNDIFDGLTLEEA